MDKPIIILCTGEDRLSINSSTDTLLFSAWRDTGGGETKCPLVSRDLLIEEACVLHDYKIWRKQTITKFRVKPFTRSGDIHGNTLHILRV